MSVSGEIGGPENRDDLRSLLGAASQSPVGAEQAELLEELAAALKTKLEAASRD